MGASTSIVTALSAWLSTPESESPVTALGRVVGELGVELGLEVGGQLATRAALRDGVVDLGDHDVEIDPVRRVRVAQPVTLTFTGSATVPVVFSGFMTSNQCRCSLQS